MQAWGMQAVQGMMMHHDDAEQSPHTEACPLEPAPSPPASVAASPATSVAPTLRQQCGATPRLRHMIVVALLLGATAYGKRRGNDLRVVAATTTGT